MSSSQRLLLAVHTEEEEVGEILRIRIISCRKVTSAEKRIYEEG